MTVRIGSDSACDRRGDEVADLGIEVVPLSIRFGDDEYTDREELTVDRFYQLLASSDQLPETAAPSPGRFAEAFQRQLDAGASSIVCINISAALSATMQSAVTAAETLDADIRIVDSKSITVGLGSIVLAAARAAAGGAGTDEVVAIVPPDLIHATVEKIAISAVMAGCLPEHLPWVITAVEAVCNDEFNMHGLLATTMPVGPVIVCSGPGTSRIGMNPGVNALGQGNRASLSIGRALQLLVRNLGGGRPGGVDRATHGNPGTPADDFSPNAHVN